MSGHLTLILGGVSSGKSARAEFLAEAAGAQRLYIATAEVRDAEMAAKVAAHRGRRGCGWATQEAPLDVPSALDGADADVVLLDCASMWLSNHLLIGSDLDHEIAALIAALKTYPVPVIVVSNEVGLGGVEANELARKFATYQGRFNQALASIADRVELVSAGLPLTLKGT